jgi:hypothetical protein
MNRPVEDIPAQVTVCSRLNAGTDELWGSVASAEGVNYEMGPWLRFLVPEGIDLLGEAASGRVLSLKLRGPLGLPLGHTRSSSNGWMKEAVSSNRPGCSRSCSGSTSE